MTFRTTVQDGLVVFNTHGQIPDGTPVDIVPRPKQSKVPTRKTSSENGRSSTVKNKTPKTAVRRKPKASSKADAFLALAGIWKDRPDWAGKSSVEVATELRRKAMGDRYNFADHSTHPIHAKSPRLP